MLTVESKRAATRRDAWRHATLVVAWRAAALIGIRRAEALFNLGNAHCAYGLRDAAITSWAAAVARDPGHARAWNNQANALIEANRLAEAAEAFGRLAALSADAAPSWYHTGKCRDRLGERALAKAAFIRCVASDPGHIGALEHLGRIALADRHGTVAIAMLPRAIARAEQPAVLHFCLGAAHELDGDVGSARQHYALAAADAALRPRAEQRLRLLEARGRRRETATSGGQNDE